MRRLGSRGGALALIAVAGCVFAVTPGCVSADLGYQDVRSLSAARLDRDVRWHEHEPVASGQLEKLLAEPLDADAAVQVALWNNQGLQAAFEDLGVARGRVVQALQLPNPTVDAAVKFRDGTTERTALELEALLDLSELVFLPLRGGVADAELEVAKASVTGQVLDLAFQTRVAFLRHQAAAQTLELRGTNLTALRASLEVASSLHQAGNITDLSLASERAMYEEARIAYTTAEAALAARREELSALMGVWGRKAEWTARERLPERTEDEPGFEQLETRALERSLDLALIRRRFSAAAKTANVATARGWVPELRAGVAAEKDYGEGWSLGPAVALEVPLFYQGQGETGAALAEARRQQKLYADTAVRIRSTARATAARLVATARSAEYYKAVLLPLRQQVVDETQLQFNAMSVDAFQLLSVKRAQIETARAYVDILRDYWISRAEAQQLLAGRLPRGGASFDDEASAAALPEQRSGAH